MTPAQLEAAVVELQGDLRVVSRTLGTLIVWIAQAANSPLSRQAAQQLTDMLPPGK
jgi:hypothetical protein